MINKSETLVTSVQIGHGIGYQYFVFGIMGLVKSLALLRIEFLILYQRERFINFSIYNVTLTKHLYINICTQLQ